jgi:hypothetical protein
MNSTRRTKGSVRYPRLWAAVRAALYLAGGVATMALLGLTVSFLGLVTVLGTLSLLVTGNANAILVAAVVGIGLVIAGLVTTLLLKSVRRADRFLLQVARGPDPLEAVAAKYVADDIDEVELERRVERLLLEAERESTAARGRALPGRADRLAEREPDLPIEVERA